MRLRRSNAADVAPVRALTAAAFASAAHQAPPVDETGQPGEAALVEWLLTDPDAVPELSWVAEGDAGGLVGHVVCSRAHVGDRPALGLGPISVDPAHQGAGVGSALMHAVLGAADALGERLVVLVGDPGFYARFGFRPAREIGVLAPDPAWGDLFQARTLTSYDGGPAGTFRPAAPFDRL